MYRDYVKVILLSLTPPSWLHVLECFGEVFGVVLDGVAGAKTRVDEVKGGCKHPFAFEVVDAELDFLSLRSF